MKSTHILVDETKPLSTEEVCKLLVMAKLKGGMLMADVMVSGGVHGVVITRRICDSGVFATSSKFSSSLIDTGMCAAEDIIIYCII